MPLTEILALPSRRSSKAQRAPKSGFEWMTALICLVISCSLLNGQSTFGTVLGTVKEATESSVPNARVTLINKGTNAQRVTLTDNSGTFQFTSVDVGTYVVTVEAAGFQKEEFSAFDLGGRETKRLDVSMKVATQTTTVNVEAAGGAIQTDTSSVAETKGSRELVDLPVAITSRGTGSTSPMSTLTAQPGVQMDALGNISIAGTLPTQLSMSIDGISTMGPGENNGAAAISELFPSFNAIEEIRIGETINPAEFGGVADITTISKAGTNNFHGGAFENFQNNDLNAADFFSHVAPEEKMNNFGIYMGGPVILPKLYNGRNKTFFFGSFEALRLPKNVNVVESVPTIAMRNGDLSGYSDPLTGYPGNQIPVSQLSPYSQRALNEFYPSPNYGPPGAIANNYLANFAIPIKSNQGDVRLDQTINSKHQIFARYTYKNRRVQQVPISSFNADSPPTSPALGSNQSPEVDGALTVAWNYTVTPTLVNELRAGFSQSRTASNFNITGQGAANALGLTNLPQQALGPLPSADYLPTIDVAGYVPIFGQSSNGNQGTKQILETLTWINGKHTFKFGADYRRLHAYFNNVFYNILEGQYDFNGSVMNSLLGPGAGTPLASFLLGYPDNSTIANNYAPDTYAMAQHYGVFAQDDFKVTHTLTLNYGLRWEYHPMFRDKFNNLCNFDPAYTSTVDGQTVKGAVILPGQGAFDLVDPGFAQSIAPTPIVTAAQANVPGALRFSQKTDFAPRVGFAWRIFGSDKMVLRGGYGKFIETLMSSAAISAWGVASSDVGFFNNSLGSNGLPVFTLPYAWPSNIAQPGTQAFYQVTDIHFKDPYVQEWNLTLERDLGKGIGVRVSYDGNHSTHLGAGADLDQVQPNTVGFGNISQSSYPYPDWSYIYYNSNKAWGNYNAATVSFQKRMSNGLQFQSSYIFSRNLSNVNGVASSTAAAFASEFGGTLSNIYDPGLDYGNVAFTRKHRFLTTALYELPFGRGKALLNNANRVVDNVVGGWELSGVLLFQSGPYMTVTLLSDPSGTGFNAFNSTGGRADTVPGVNPYAGQSINQWINPNAFADPGSAIGRYGDSQGGGVVGPGTSAVSASLIKTVHFSEHARIQFGAQIANLFNHPNFAVPASLTVGVAGFGQITALQSAEGAGPRAIQLTGRIVF